MAIKTKKDVTPTAVLKELKKYWLDRHYPLNAMIAGLPREEFGDQFTVGDLIRLAIKQDNKKKKETKNG